MAGGLARPLHEARPEKLPATTLQSPAPDRVAQQLAKINHMNAKKTDAFMAALLENRPDLAGLPFAMGDDCRTSPERMKLTYGIVDAQHEARRERQAHEVKGHSLGL